jgi:FMN phosphatase YigB (HAD superfamily)
LSSTQRNTNHYLLCSAPIRSYSPTQNSSLPEDKHEEFVTSTFKVFIEHRNSVLENIFDGVLPLLQRLRERGLVVAALTNGNAELHNIGNLLSDELFVIHINPEMVGAAKPEPHMFERLLELTGAQAHEVSIEYC